MDLKKILAISGYPELYKFINTTKNGVLVEAISSKKRMIAFSHYRISTLEDISVFTETGEIPLKDVFRKILKKTEGKEIDIKMSDKQAIEKFIESVLPEYDRDRVKFSDMKKIIKWYNLLLKHGYIKLEEENDEQTEDNKEKETENKE